MAYPRPPKYYQQYTAAAVAAGTAPAPPPRPVATQFMVYGATWEMNASHLSRLPDMDVSAPGFDHAVELRKSNKTVARLFLDILQCLVDGKEEDTLKAHLEKLNAEVLKMHFVLNEFRPHQAAATIRAMLEQQLADRERLDDQLKQHMKEAQSIIQRATQQLETLATSPKQNIPALSATITATANETAATTKPQPAKKAKDVLAIPSNQLDDEEADALLLKAVEQASL
eukprot:m.4593 g.4593  ORF g.4593 m.4593 type:complete len:228 (-) comp4523_c0_seq1:148-831(-)